MSLCRLLALSCLMVLGSISVSSAQGLNNAAAKKIQKPINVITSGLATEVNARVAHGYNRTLASPSPSFQGGAALSTFELNFKNGDHKLRHIAVKQSADKAEFVLADQDSNDPYNAAAVWYQLPAYLEGEVTAVGGGEFDIVLPESREGFTPVIKGFSFERGLNTDANIRAIGVRFLPDQNVVRVNLIDDQGADLRGFGEAIAGSFALTALPLGVIAGSNWSIVEAAQARDIHGTIGGFRRYMVTVQYVWVANNLIVQRDSQSGSSGRADSGSTPRFPKTALRGFIAYFNNSDHHLLQLRVYKDNLGNYNMSYRDGDAGDPYQWTIDYVSLK